MNTIAWLFIILAALLIRGVFKGRVTELPGDLRDLMLGALTGDMEAVKEVSSRTGEGLTAPATEATQTSVAGGTEGSITGANGAASAKGAALLAEAKKIGTGKPYQWGRTFSGGGGGDCSGLVWRAMKNLGYFTGGRFATYTFPAATRSIVTVVTDPKPGDIAVWQRGGTRGHMGIVSGPGTFFSALSRASGVKEAKISGITGRLTYYRLR